MNKRTLSAAIAALLAAFYLAFSYTQRTSTDIVTFNGSDKFRTWQGVAADTNNIYVTTDRNARFGLQDIISVYDLRGHFVKEKLDAYTGKDHKGRFMSFGDATVINGRLYALVYNYNAGGSNDPIDQRESRIVVYTLPDLNVANEHDIGSGTAEAIDYNIDSYWVVYQDLHKIRRFDNSFKLTAEYNLNAEFSDEGGYQGMIFMDDDLYVNLHGSNEFGKKYAFGLDHYKFAGSQFKHVERIRPPTYGAGQGIDRMRDKFLWVDRPANEIVITRSLKTK